MKHNNNKQKKNNQNADVIQRIQKLLQALGIKMNDIKDPDVLYALACCFELSPDKKDKKKVIRYFFKAAAKGQVEAMRRLITIYNNTKDEKNKNIILRWLFKAMANGQAEASKELRKLLAQQDQLFNTKDQQ